MNRKVSYYASRKSVLVWLAVAALAVSAVLRIAYSCGKGADAATVWLQIFLPVFACLSYALTLAFHAERRLYRTTVPVVLLAVYFCARIASMGVGTRYTLLCWIAYAAFAAVYGFVISGCSRHAWFLVLMHAAALGVALYDCRALLGTSFAAMLPALPDILLLLAGMLKMIGTKI